MANDSIETVVASLKHIVDVRIDSDERARIVDYAPDSSDAEYGGNTEPGSAWNAECDSRLAEIRAALPSGWSAEWVDDDLVIDRDETSSRVVEVQS